MTDWTVHAVYTSPLAAKIDRVIRWIDARSDTDAEQVRLLIVPSRQLHAFWLYSEQDRLVVVDKPRTRLGPVYQRLYSADEFLEALSKGRDFLAEVLTTMPSKTPFAVSLCSARSHSDR